MTLKSIFIQFTFIYILLIFIISSLFTLFGMEDGIWVLALILMYLIEYLCNKYYRKNGRAFSKKEKKYVIIVLSSLNILILYLLMRMSFWTLTTKFMHNEIIFIVSLLGLMSAIAIYWFVNKYNKHNSEYKCVNCQKVFIYKDLKKGYCPECNMIAIEYETN